MGTPRTELQAPELKSKRTLLAAICLFLTLRAIIPGNISAQLPAGTIPAINVGGGDLGYLESEFASLDFAQKLLEEQRRDMEARNQQRQKLLDSGTVSVLDLQASPKAIGEFNKGEEFLQKQSPKEAVVHFQKALAAYPKFVSAHNNLAVAYTDMDNSAQAKTELEAAVKLDPKFAATYVNLGRLELSEKDYGAAVQNLGKAIALRPADASVLTVLAYAQNSNGEYHHVIETVARVHALPHKGLANVHYVAASAAIAVKDFPTVQRELELFLQEDPTNPLAPAARSNLAVLASYGESSHTSLGTTAVSGKEQPVQTEVVRTFPNSDALKNALTALGDEEEACKDCSVSEPAVVEQPAQHSVALADVTASAAGIGSSGVWKIRDVVDEVAVFFAATNHGKLVNDLTATDLSVRDDDKPPSRVLEFAPQSKLPLRLALLMDTSGSLQKRFDFEKKAAERFLKGILKNRSDLAFVAGFANEVHVTQDFTADTNSLSAGIEALKINGGTAIWDAVSYACWKLAAFPEKERVARVLVVLTDGEDNASHGSLKRAIHDAESTGVTVYTISTRDYAEIKNFGKSDADKVLQALAERTGGEAMIPGEVSALDRTFAKLRDVIRSRYLVAYKPAALQNDGHFRKISIIASKNGHRLKVYAREGYYAPLEPSK